jgi:inhibitor of KinA sporulation pathway (predicted exonuclease)
MQACYKSKRRIEGVVAKIGGKINNEVIDCFFEWLWESKRPAVSRRCNI